MTWTLQTSEAFDAHTEDDGFKIRHRMGHGFSALATNGGTGHHTEEKQGGDALVNGKSKRHSSLSH